MIISIIHSAISRKMLCKPVNSLISETELVCAIGIACQMSEIEADIVDKICEQTTIGKVREEFFKSTEKVIKDIKESPFQNLIEMIKAYRFCEQELTEKLKEILYYGYRNPIVYPKGNF